MKTKLFFICSRCQDKVDINLESCKQCCCKCKETIKLSENNRKEIQLFYDLLVQIQRSKSILDNSMLSIKMKDNSIDIPYKLLITKFQNSISINCEGNGITIYHLDSEEKIL